MYRLFNLREQAEKESAVFCLTQFLNAILNKSMGQHDFFLCKRRKGRAVPASAAATDY